MTPVLAQRFSIVLNFARVHLGQQVRRVCVDHGGEQLYRQCRVAKSFAQAVANGISSLRVYLRLSQFFFTGDVVLELLVEFAAKVNLEDQGEYDRRNDGNPFPRFEPQLQADSYKRISLILCRRIRYDSLRTINSCMRMMEMRTRLTTIFHKRWE